MLINKKYHNYAAKFQEPAFNDGSIFTLKNELLLWYGIATHSGVGGGGGLGALAPPLGLRC